MKVKSSKGHNPVSECLVQALYFLFFYFILFLFLWHTAQGCSSCKGTISCNAQDSGHHHSEANNLLFDLRTQMSFPLIFINIFNC